MGSTSIHQRLLEPSIARPGSDDPGADGATVELAPGVIAAAACRPLPGFPVDALPGPLSRFVEETATATQTPADLAAASVLAVASAAAMGGAVVECAAGWVEELALFMLTLLDSGERKSPVLRAAVAPLRAIDIELRTDAGPVIRLARARRDVLEDERVATRKKKTGATAEELERIDAELDAIGEPVEPRLLADDATPEALAGLLARHPKIAILAAESAFLDNIAGAYRDGNPNLHLVCQAYGGEATTVDRRARPAENIPRPLLTLGLAVQPHLLAKLRGSEAMLAQGFLARVAFALPASTRGRRALDPPPVTQATADAYDRAIRCLAAVGACDGTDATPVQARSVGSVAGPQVQRLRFSPAAAAAFHELRAATEPRLTPGSGDLDQIASWANKHPGRVARIAAIMHLAEHEPDEPIGEPTMRDAMRIGDYLVEHAIAALTDDATADAARRVWRWIETNDRRRASVRDAHRGAFGAHGKAELAEAALDRLAASGTLRRLPRPEPGSTGGRPASAEYEVMAHNRAAAS